MGDRVDRNIGPLNDAILKGKVLKQELDELKKLLYKMKCMGEINEGENDNIVAITEKIKSMEEKIIENDATIARYRYFISIYTRKRLWEEAGEEKYFSVTTEVYEDPMIDVQEALSRKGYFHSY